jgi:hypothetical protein
MCFCYAECSYPDCLVSLLLYWVASFFIFMLSVVFLYCYVFIMSAYILSVIILSVVILLNVFILSVIILSVVVMLSLGNQIKHELSFQWRHKYTITIIHWLSIYTSMKHSLLLLETFSACTQLFRQPVWC